MFPLIRKWSAVLVLLAASLLLGGPTARAQGKGKSLTVRLTVLSDTDGLPVIGAACVLPDYGIYSITDPDGIAVLQKVPSGKTTLEIQCLGFEDYKQTYDFQGDEELTVRIQESNLVLEQVVVTATASAAGSSTRPGNSIFRSSRRRIPPTRSISARVSRLIPSWSRSFPRAGSRDAPNRMRSWKRRPRNATSR